MKLQKVLSQSVDDGYIKINNFLDQDESSFLKDVVDDFLDDEDPSDDVYSRFLPPAIFNLLPKTKIVEDLKSLFDKASSVELLKKFNIDLTDTQKVSTTISVEKYNSYSKSIKKSNLGSHDKSITLCIFITESDAVEIAYGDKNIKIGPGELLVYQDIFGIATQTKNNTDKDLYVLKFSIKTELANPSIIYNQNTCCDVGVIINCKDNESPSQYKGLEYGLANFTRINLTKNNFSNIVIYSNRSHFDEAVKTLKSSGVKKIILLFAGSIVNSETYQMVLSAPHITAWKEDDVVMRRYVIFDPHQYTGFQTHGDFLSNVKDQIVSKEPGDFGIISLQPDEKTYQFLEQVYDGLIPDIGLLDSDEEGDTYQASIIIEEMKKIVLNTV